MIYTLKEGNTFKLYARSKMTENKEVEFATIPNCDTDSY